MKETLIWIIATIVGVAIYAFLIATVDVALGSLIFIGLCGVGVLWFRFLQRRD